MSAWRQARAIALLPRTAALAVPAIILVGGDGPSIGWGLDAALAASAVLLGVVLIVLGLGFWAWTVRLFARIGRGTLAPWDPTQHLVVQGPCSRVRNPMITAVFTALVGEAVLLGSPGILGWCAVFLRRQLGLLRPVRGACP